MNDHPMDYAELDLTDDSPRVMPPENLPIVPLLAFLARYGYRLEIEQGQIVGITEDA